MLFEFRELEASDPKVMERVTQTIHHLIRYQFLHTEDRGSPPLLEMLRRPRIADAIENYFDTAGYRLVQRPSEGRAGILPDVERVGHPRMAINETLVLLILARIWQEGMQNGNVSNFATVLTTLNDAYDAYVDLVAKTRRQALRIEEFRDAVQELGRRAVVKLHAFDDDEQDQELAIRPAVGFLAGDDLLATLETFIKQNPVPVEEIKRTEPNESESTERSA